MVGSHLVMTQGGLPIAAYVPCRHLMSPVRIAVTKHPSCGNGRECFTTVYLFENGPVLGQFLCYGLPGFLRNYQNTNSELGHDARRFRGNGSGISAPFERFEGLRTDITARLLHVLAIILEITSFESLKDHHRVLDEAFARFAEGDAEAVEFDTRDTTSETEDHAAVRVVVNYRHLLGDSYRIMPRKHYDHRAELDPVGSSGVIGQELKNIRTNRI